jgi:RNA polymerase sigma factor (sigma-70 family)
MFATHEIEAQIPRLRRYARALVGSREHADDLVQDTLERAWSKLHLWRPGSNLRAWLFSIMHNVHVNQVRSRASQKTEALDDDAPEIPVRAAQNGWMEVRDLEKALKRLPDEQREILLLVGLEQMGYKEVAQALGIPIGTVMSRLSRGRERLRALMHKLPEKPTLRAVE